jgi:hypothetical protein
LAGIACWILIKLLLTARRTEIIGVALIVALSSGLPLVDLHATHRVFGHVTSLLSSYRATFRSLSALAMTETELKVIAALAIIGLSSSPNMG